MKSKLLMGIGTLLLASSSMFAGWGFSVGVGGPRYVAPRAGVVVAGGPVYRPYYYAPYYASGPYAYVAPPRVYSVWIPAHWEYGPRGRFWVRGHYGRR